MAKNTNKYFTQCQYRKPELIRNQRNTKWNQMRYVTFLKNLKQEIWQAILANNLAFSVLEYLSISWLVTLPLAAHPRESFVCVSGDIYQQKSIAPVCKHSCS